MIKPLSPAEALEAKQKAIPEFVIEAFNAVIVRNLSNNGRASFRQDEVIKEIQERGGQIRRDALFSNNWLDVEPIYRAAGWKVDYDRPGYNETYEPTFTFSK